MAFTHNSKGFFPGSSDDRLSKSISAMDAAAIEEFVALVEKQANDYERRYIFSHGKPGWRGSS
jgi:hypothetical protein